MKSILIIFIAITTINCKNNQAAEKKKAMEINHELHFQSGFVDTDLSIYLKEADTIFSGRITTDEIEGLAHIVELDKFKWDKIFINIEGKIHDVDLSNSKKFIGINLKNNGSLIIKTSSIRFLYD